VGLKGEGRVRVLDTFYILQSTVNWPILECAMPGKGNDEPGPGDGETKRPSVETEGRLTIACHMKNLKKIVVVTACKPHKDKN
jgi:hypothetical protein